MSEFGQIEVWLTAVDATCETDQVLAWASGNVKSKHSKRKREKPSNTQPREGERVRALGEISGNVPCEMSGRGSKKRQRTYAPEYYPPSTDTRTSTQSPLSPSIPRSGQDSPRRLLEKAGVPVSLTRVDDNSADESGEDELGDVTPRPPRVSSASRLVPSKVRPASAASSPSRTSTSEASSTRSYSPLKKIDLALAKIPTEFCPLDGSVAERIGGVLERYCRLVEIRHGHHIIPSSMKGPIEALLHRYDWPMPHHYSPPTTASNTLTYEKHWLAQFKDLSRQAGECERESHSEGSWNHLVHFRVLQMVTQSAKYRERIALHSITTAQIQPRSLAPEHRSGHKFQSKLVDFAICLNPQEHILDRIRQTLALLPDDAQSINQTLYPPLRRRPIAINIETKTPFHGGETADVQMSVWAGAGLKKLSQFLGLSGKTTNGRIPTLPVLTFFGHDLYMSTITAEQSRNVVHGQLFLGSTRTVIGIYQLVAALDVLIDWADTDYRAWMDSILL